MAGSRFYSVVHVYACGKEMNKRLGGPWARVSEVTTEMTDGGFRIAGGAAVQGRDDRTPNFVFCGQYLVASESGIRQREFGR